MSLDPKDWLRLWQEDKLHFLNAGHTHFDPDKAESKEGRLHYYLSPPLIDAVIVHPSFACPLILAPGAPIEVHVLISKSLEDLALRATSPQASTTAWQELVNRLQLQLQIRPWAGRAQAKAQFKYERIGQQNFYDGHFEHALAAVSVSRPQAIEGTELVLRDSRDVPIALLAPSRVAEFKNQGFVAYLRIQLSDHQLATGAYNLAWLSLKNCGVSFPQSADWQLFYEPEDRLLHSSLQAQNCHIATGFVVPDRADSLQLANDDPIQSYHPIFILDKPYLQLGHLTDVHLSSRQILLKNNPVKLLKDGPEALFPRLGARCNDSLSAFRSLLDQMGQDPEVDILCITGDLIDFTWNLDPLVARLRPGFEIQDSWHHLDLIRAKKMSVWDPELLSAKPHTRDAKNLLEASHTRGIDTLLFYALIRDFYDKYQKPILVTTGNHDAYDEPYGISPRVGTYLQEHLDKLGPHQQSVDPTGYFYTPADPTEPDAIYQNPRGAALWFKANRSIPMDHNLTFYEALLLFGPGYSHILRYPNFMPQNFAFFHNLLSPLTDYSFSYRNQRLSALSWGTEEHLPLRDLIAENTQKWLNQEPLTTACLPMPGAYLTHLQMAVLLGGQAQPDTRYHILLSHAPIINYEPEQSLTKSNGELKSYPFDSASSHYGTQTATARSVWALWEQAGLTHCLSGHTHRPAIYSASSQSTHITARPYPRSGLHTQFLASMGAKAHDKTLLVTGSAGPISTRNDSGEFKGLALGAPHGAVLAFNDEGARLRLIEAQHTTAKPRLCVLVDSLLSEYAAPFQMMQFLAEDSSLLGLQYAHASFKELFSLKRAILYRKQGDNSTLISSTLKPGSGHYDLVLDLSERFGRQDVQKQSAFRKQIQYFLLFYFDIHDRTSAGTFDAEDPWILQVDLLAPATKPLAAGPRFVVSSEWLAPDFDYWQAQEHLQNAKSSLTAFEQGLGSGIQS